MRRNERRGQRLTVAGLAQPVAGSSHRAIGPARSRRRSREHCCQHSHRSESALHERQPADRADRPNRQLIHHLPMSPTPGPSATRAGRTPAVIMRMNASTSTCRHNIPAASVRAQSVQMGVERLLEHGVHGSKRHQGDGISRSRRHANGAPSNRRAQRRYSAASGSDVGGGWSPNRFGTSSQAHRWA